MSQLSSSIKTALVQGYLTAMAGTNVPVMLENRAFTPPDGSVPTTAASSWVEFATPPLAGATVTVNGTVYTASSLLTPVPPVFNKTLAGFVAGINATLQGTPHPDVVATVSGTKAVLTARSPGWAGNALTLAASSLPISGAVFTGGTLNPAWTALYHVPADRSAQTLGATGEDELLGFLQVDVNVPINSGEGIQAQVINLVESYFTAGRALASGGVTVNIIRNQLSGARKVDNWHRRSLSIYYRAHLQRPTIA